MKMYQVLIMNQADSVGITVFKHSLGEELSIYLYRLNATGEEALDSFHDYDVIFTGTKIIEKKWVDVIERVKKNGVCAVILDDAYKCLDQEESCYLDQIQREEASKLEDEDKTEQEKAFDQVVQKYWNRKHAMTLKKRQQHRVFQMFLYKEKNDIIKYLRQLTERYMNENESPEDVVDEIRELIQSVWDEINVQAPWISYIEPIKIIIDKNTFYEDIEQICTQIKRLIQKYELDNENSIVNRICRVMNENIDKKNPVEYVIRDVELSRDYIGRILKKKLGMPLLDLQTILKMEYSKKLLRETNHKIYEIGETLGYTTADYFSRLFRDYTGMTPGQYRKHNTGILV